MHPTHGCDAALALQIGMAKDYILLMKSRPALMAPPIKTILKGNDHEHHPLFQ